MMRAEWYGCGTMLLADFVFGHSARGDETMKRAARYSCDTMFCAGLVFDHSARGVATAKRAAARYGGERVRRMQTAAIMHQARLVFLH